MNSTVITLNTTIQQDIKAYLHAKEVAAQAAAASDKLVAEATSLTETLCPELSKAEDLLASIPAPETHAAERLRTAKADFETIERKLLGMSTDLSRLEDRGKIRSTGLLRDYKEQAESNLKEAGQRELSCLSSLASVSKSHSLIAEYERIARESTEGRIAAQSVLTAILEQLEIARRLDDVPSIAELMKAEDTLQDEYYRRIDAAYNARVELASAIKDEVSADRAESLRSISEAASNARAEVEIRLQAARCALEQARTLPPSEEALYLRSCIPRAKAEMEAAQKMLTFAQEAADEEHQRNAERLENVTCISNRVADVKRRIHAANSEAKRALDRVVDTNAGEQRAQRELPDWLVDWGASALSEILELPKGSQNWTELQGVSWPEYSTRERLAIMRRDLEQDCDCENGIPWRTWNHVMLPLSAKMLDFNDNHEICAARTQFDRSFIKNLIPSLHCNHRLYNLQPFAGNPIAHEKQAKVIQKIPTDLTELRGLLICGPGGTSKTTLVSASLVDTLTLRQYRFRKEHDENPPVHHCCWRIKVPRYLAEMAAWDTREFDDDTVQPPVVTPDVIARECAEAGLKPILWVEELDKFNPTASGTRQRYLHDILDEVYELGGTIVTTTNMKPTELKAHIDKGPYTLYRRIAGENDRKEDYLVLNLWSLQGKGGSARP
ncbi:MAG: hypothetical protein JWP08_2993 [Bryobacterales bacterium]|nr:hypothetical protein [Bryobacterales bacterium]